jgi:CO dehydrogenase maturation factor
MTKKTITVAVSGKGGTGKTTISALLVRSFISFGYTPVLAVDADPNANLHEALGVSVQETLGAMREEAFTRQIPPGMARTAYIRYRFRQVLVESDGFDLIAMGRPEGTGCYCFANDLLKTAMRTLEREYHFIVIDSEAGMEHIARGTIGRPDVLLVVTDPGARGMRTAARIREIARNIGIDENAIQLVLNRYHGKTAEVPGATRPAAWIPDDPAVAAADLAGTPVGAILPDSPALAAVRQLAERLALTFSRHE